jgi:hypothetical protein
MSAPYPDDHFSYDEGYHQPYADRGDDIPLDTYMRPAAPASFLPGGASLEHPEYAHVPNVDAPESTAYNPHGEHEEQTGRQESTGLLSTSDKDGRVSPSPTPAGQEFDPFEPIFTEDEATGQSNPLTVRAVALGIFFGALVNAAELYGGTSGRNSVISSSPESVKLKDMVQVSKQAFQPAPAWSPPSSGL